MAAQRKGRLSDKLVDVILAYIAEHDLHAGDKLPNEAELMRITGAGRSSVREAMKTLASRNIVTIKQGSGTYLADMPGAVDDPLGFAFVRDKNRLANDLLELRSILEPEIASLAAKRANDDDIRTINLISKQFEEAVRAGDDPIPKDIEFHEALALSSRNIVVPRLIPIISSSVSLSIQLTESTLVHQSVDAHRLIAEAIADHDPLAARQTMYAHIFASWQMLRHTTADATDYERMGRDMLPDEFAGSPLARSLELSTQEILEDLLGSLRIGNRSTRPRY